MPVIGFSFADPHPWLERAKAGGAVTLCQVQTLQGAHDAIAAGADILVAQGHEARGHTGKMPLCPLLTRFLDTYPDIPVLAAGGIGNGSTLAAALATGAAGAWVGTAFVATPECIEVPDAYKERLVASRGEDTIFTEVFDILDPAIFKIPAWPEGIAARACNNRFVQEWHGREEELRRNLNQVVPAYLEALERRDPDVCAVYMGQSVEVVSSIKPAGDVLATMCDEAARILKKPSS